MATSKECSVAWKNGYLDGWSDLIKSTQPSIPSRPGSFPAGKDPLVYYYDAGKQAGYLAANRSLAGITKS